MKKILIIEDEAIISFSYRLQMERMGFEVIGTAKSAEEAEQIMRDERPDLIIMDVYLKGPKTGLELAQELHSSDPVPIPILFLTASTKPEVVESIRALKGCQYLPKPINSDSLEDMLQRFARE
ncbi:MAG: response regulator [Flavobacteriales bacterium]|nr:response regulator [Flavobacteriales bacterium]